MHLFTHKPTHFLWLQAFLNDIFMHIFRLCVHGCDNKTVTSIWARLCKYGKCSIPTIDWKYYYRGDLKLFGYARLFYVFEVCVINSYRSLLYWVNRFISYLVVFYPCVLLFHLKGICMKHA